MFPPIGLLSLHSQNLGHGPTVGQNVDCIDSKNPKSRLIRPLLIVSLDGTVIGASTDLSNTGYSSGGQTDDTKRRMASFNLPELRSSHADRITSINLATGYQANLLSETMR